MTTPTTLPTVASIPGVNVCLMGPSGTGKTYSVATAVEAGLEVFLLSLEPGLEALLAYWTKRGQPIPPNLHWHVIKGQENSFLDMAANRIGSEMFEAHRDLYELLAAGDFDSARLLEIEQNEQIKAMSGEDLHSFLVAKSLIFYDKILFKIKTSKDIETTEKSFFIQKVMAAKERLKKGELSEIDDSIVSLFG